ncbi:MAG: hypothetical protein RBR50_10135 [Candidatus Izemoplasmatales bacterium]|nr:hypothetical protein [Candidatus Izemoplasmatales bacterium]
MTPKEAFEMLEKCGTNTEQPYEDMILEALYQALTELEVLKRDVKRFMELKNNITNREEMDEFWEIDNKLSKVGKGE